MCFDVFLKIFDDVSQCVSETPQKNTEPHNLNESKLSQMTSR